MVLWRGRSRDLQPRRAVGHEDACPLPAQAGRDLFDLWLALTEQDVDPDEIIRCFTRYMTFGATAATRAQFEANMAAKLADTLFVNDIKPLLRPGLEYDIDSRWALVHESLVRRLPGDPWKGLAS